jgi:hypothetical protein
MNPLAEFKFACPVCHQHIVTAAVSAGYQIECPTCFRQIVVPKAPGGATTRLILRGTHAAAKKQTRFHAAPRKTPPVHSPLVAVTALTAFFLAGLIFAFNHVKHLTAAREAAPQSIETPKSPTL